MPWKCLECGFEDQRGYQDITFFLCPECESEEIYHFTKKQMEKGDFK
jgi:predicted Zn-ribbon and HTH transcriptional regulator